jgi:hypothetical protein
MLIENVQQYIQTCLNMRNRCPDARLVNQQKLPDTLNNSAGENPQQAQQEH